MNRGLMLAPDSFTALKARITRGNAQRSAPANKPVPEKVAAAPVPNGNAECRPKGATLRCTSQCSNGNCVVTYENGCKIRVQVQPRFDSFPTIGGLPRSGLLNPTKRFDNTAPGMARRVSRLESLKLILFM